MLMRYRIKESLQGFVATVMLATCAPIAAWGQADQSIAEDFSLFTAGSEEAPSTAINSTDGTIPSRYFHQPGWTGYGVHQANGTCALINPDAYGAQLNTVVGHYDGAYVVKVRAKTLPGNKQDNARLNIGLWEDAANQYNQTNYYENFVTTKGEWREFTYEFNNTSYAGSDRMFVAFYTNDQVVIDDVSVERSTTLSAPTTYKATDYTPDGFTAHWSAVKGATHYLFSLFHNEATPVTEDHAYTENFASLSSDQLPEGWTYQSATGAAPTVYQNSEGGVASALMLRNGDVVTMPDDGGRITSLTFSIIECHLPKNPEDLWGTEIHVQLWNGTSWSDFTTIQVDASEYGNQLIHDIDWSRFMEKDKYKCQSVRFRLSGLPDDCAFGLTDFAWSTRRSSTTVYDIRDLRVEDTHYTVTGLNETTDYAYSVKACSDDAVSAPSTARQANGLPAPVVEAATEVTANGFTAHWQPVAKATAYEVSHYDVYTAPADASSYVVLAEDFSKIANTGVGIERPFAFQNSSYKKLGMDMVYRDGWQCLWGGYADGCFVGTGLTEYNISGELLTPELTLSNNNGLYHVKVTARSMLKDDVLQVYSRKSGQGVECELSPDEWRVFETDVTGGQLDDIVVFTTARHYPFIIDDIEISQDLKAGDRVFEYIASSDAIDQGATQYRVEDLATPADHHAYAFGVTALRATTAGDFIRSDRSAYQVVAVASDVARPKATMTAHETGRYTIDGRRANAQTHGLVIVKFSDGSVRRMLQK